MIYDDELAEECTLPTPERDGGDNVEGEDVGTELQDRRIHRRAGRRTPSTDRIEGAKGKESWESKTSQQGW